MGSEGSSPGPGSRRQLSGTPEAGPRLAARAAPPSSRPYSRGVEPPPGGPWEFMIAPGPALGPLAYISAQRTECRAPEHYLGPATRPLSRLPRPGPARVEPLSGHLSAPANPSDPWTESPGASMAIESGPWMPEASWPPSPHPHPHRQTRAQTHWLQAQTEHTYGKAQRSSGGPGKAETLLRI